MTPLFPGLMGVQLVELAQDHVVADMRVRPDLCTGNGILHGGAYMAFADTLGAVVRGDCRALHRGRTTHVWQTQIFNGDGRLCAVVTQTQLLLDAKG